MFLAMTVVIARRRYELVGTEFFELNDTHKVVTLGFSFWEKSCLKRTQCSAR